MNSRTASIRRELRRRIFFRHSPASASREDASRQRDSSKSSASLSGCFTSAPSSAAMALSSLPSDVSDFARSKARASGPCVRDLRRETSGSFIRRLSQSANRQRLRSCSSGDGPRQDQGKYRDGSADFKTHKRLSSSLTQEVCPGILTPTKNQKMFFLAGAISLFSKKEVRCVGVRGSEVAWRQLQ